MRNIGLLQLKFYLMLLLYIFSTYLYALPLSLHLEDKIQNQVNNIQTANPIESLSNLLESTLYTKSIYTNFNIEEIKTLLEKESPSLSPSAINKVLTALNCNSKLDNEQSNILTLIDYSLPSNEKRLWVFDLDQKKRLFHTYVSHGLKSGSLWTAYFSNKNNSKASSLGVFKTEKTYYGRDGLSLRLEGLEKGFNDNAFNRYIVMHGSWYVEEDFIKKYGRPGRSWGCPALPLNTTQALIDTIKNKALFIVYYPDEQWLLSSKFLHCSPLALNPTPRLKTATLEKPEDSLRENILFVDLKNSLKVTENTPILTMQAHAYTQHLKQAIPLERMLRRQMDGNEYIALSTDEVKSLVNKSQKDYLNSFCFIIPVIKNIRGYYETQMKSLNLGKIKNLALAKSTNKEQAPTFVLELESKKIISLRPSNLFIRWIGL